MFMTFGVVNVGYNQSLTYCPHSGHRASPKKCNVTPSSEEAKKGNVTPSSEEAYVDVVKRDTKKMMIVLILGTIYIRTIPDYPSTLSVVKEERMC